MTSEETQLVGKRIVGAQAGSERDQV